MRLGPLRIAAVALAVAAATVPGLANAATRPLQTDNGVVQSVSETQIELRALDGSVVALTVGPATKIRLNGAPSSLSALRPGFVAEVLHRGARPAVLVRAFGKVPIVTERGVVTSLTRAAITVRRDDGVVVTVALDASTRFRRLGQPVGRHAARPGARVAVRHPESGAARLVTVLRRP